MNRRSIQRGMKVKKPEQDVEPPKIFKAELRKENGGLKVHVVTDLTEVLIGKLAGTVTQGQRTELSPTGESVDGMPKNDLYKFRILAANEELVEELLAPGAASMTWLRSIACLSPHSR